MLTITAEDPNSPDALQLIEALSDVLAVITGDSGKASFDPEDVRAVNARFVIARDSKQRAVGCGAFRPLHAGVAEIKRMYARPGTFGVGTRILAFLEAEAAALGFEALYLETRLINQRAVNFYEARAYRRIPNYGKYAGNPAAVCFEKRLRSAE